MEVEREGHLPTHVAFMRSRANHEYIALSFHLSDRSAVRGARDSAFSYFLFVNKQSGAARRVAAWCAPGAAAEVRQLIISINGHNSISNRARPEKNIGKPGTGRKRPYILHLPRFPFPPSLFIPLSLSRSRPPR